MIDAAAEAGVPLGVGTGWRVQPDPPRPGSPNPGNSWHESCPVDPASATALAIDTVPDISWDWMYANCRRLRDPHLPKRQQRAVARAAVEIPTSRNCATTMPALVTWPLPGSREGDDDMPLSDEDIDKDRRRRVGAVPRCDMDRRPATTGSGRRGRRVRRQTKVNVEQAVSQAVMSPTSLTATSDVADPLFLAAADRRRRRRPGTPGRNARWTARWAGSSVALIAVAFLLL